MAGRWGATFQTPAAGYAMVYQIEILVLFATMLALAPLVRVLPYTARPTSKRPMGLADFPH